MLTKTYISLPNQDVTPDMVEICHVGRSGCKYPECGGWLMRDYDEEIRCCLCEREHDEDGYLLPLQYGRENFTPYDFPRRKGRRL